VPAYVSLMIESLTDAGIKMGLNWETSLLIASQAIVGGGSMVSDGLLHPSEIKNMVASPAGTTIAGIYQLEKNNFRAAIMSAVEASTLRAKELSNNTNKK
nr:pyrroline-5-carboxylate reductase [Pseudomonadota bacterium]